MTNTMADLQETHYVVLGLTPKADTADIKKAYRRLAREYHPDVNGGSAYAEERFKKISAAYNTLSDPGKRLVYDMQLLNELMGDREPMSRQKYRTQTYQRRRHHSYHKRHSTHSTTQQYSRFVIWSMVIGVLILAFTIFYAFSSYQVNRIYDEAVRIREEDQQPSKALTYLLAKESTGFGYSASHYLMAAEISLYTRQDYQLAGDLATKGLGQDPDREERSALLFIIGKYEMYNNQTGKAFSTFKFAYNNGEGPDSALYAMAEIKTLKEHDYLGGIQLSDQLIERAPAFSHAWFLKAYAYHKLNQNDVAKEMVLKFLKAEPESGIGNFLLARIRMANESDQPAICEALYKAATGGYPVGKELKEQYCP